MYVDYIIVGSMCETFRAGTIDFKYIANVPWFEEQIIKPTSVPIPKDIAHGLNNLILKHEINSYKHKPLPNVGPGDYLILQYYYIPEDKVYYFLFKVLRPEYMLVELSLVSVYETFKDAIKQIC